MLLEEKWKLLSSNIPNSADKFDVWWYDSYFVVCCTLGFPPGLWWQSPSWVAFWVACSCRILNSYKLWRCRSLVFFSWWKKKWEEYKDWVNPAGKAFFLMILVYLMIFIYCQASMLNRTCFFLLGGLGNASDYSILSLWSPRDYLAETWNPWSVGHRFCGNWDLHPRSLTASRVFPWKMMVSWKMILSFPDGLFSGANLLWNFQVGMWIWCPPCLLTDSFPTSRPSCIATACGNPCGRLPHHDFCEASQVWHDERDEDQWLDMIDSNHVSAFMIGRLNSCDMLHIFWFVSCGTRIWSNGHVEMCATKRWCDTAASCC